MTKRIIALSLCLIACITVFAGCSGSIPADSDDKGQQITMYLTENIYNLDPAYAYTNAASKNIVGMLFDTLFTVDDNGKVKESLAASYRTETTDDGEYFMYIEIKEDARWSDNQPLTADDVVFAWKRLLNPNNAYSSASLLFDIKNAREYNEAEVTKDDLGISADGKHLTIEFDEKNGEPDYDQFLLNLTSLALAPLREDVVSKNEDWAKKPGAIVTSGPFKLSKLNFYKEDVKLPISGALFTNDGSYPLVEKYTSEVVKDGEIERYYLNLELYSDIYWSNGQTVLSDDVVSAWESILDPNASSENAASLYAIKNAEAYNNGTLAEGETLGLKAVGKRLTIEFENKMDEEDIAAFIKSLASSAFSPVFEDDSSSDSFIYKSSYSDINYDEPKVNENNEIVTDRNGDNIYIEGIVERSEKGQRISSFVLERNLYYYRNAEDAEKLDVSVTPYRILVDCGMSDDALKKAYDEGIVLYVGDIPMSMRKDVKSEAKVYDSLSTNLCYLNQNAYIYDGTETGSQLFKNDAVRQALSMAVDREKIAEEVVFAKAATGLVPDGVYDTNSKDSLFRDKAGASSEYLSLDIDAAKALLADANITPSDYSFSITVSSYDDVHMFVAKALVAAWGEDGLGFNVKLNVRGTIANNDYHKDVKGIPSDLCDDLWAEDLASGNFDVAILDLVAPSADPFSLLAPFAKEFAGQKMDMSNPESYELATHITGYDSAQYSEIIEKIFNNKDTKGRSSDLHAAEDLLMKDMPVIPIIFNQSAYLINEDALDLNSKILFWDKASDYYSPISFNKLEVKGYEDYCVKCAEYIVDNFDSWKTNPASYFGQKNFAELSVAEFIEQNSNYLYLFKDKDYDFLPAPAEETTAAAEETTVAD